jgi:hypothetical protein
VIGLVSNPRHGPKVITQQGAEALILLNLDDGHYYALDEVGRRVWELCDGSRTVAEIVLAVGQEYDAPVQSIEADVLELLTDLARDKLVVLGP